MLGWLFGKRSQEEDHAKRFERKNAEAEKYMDDLRTIILLKQQHSTHGLKSTEEKSLIKACEFIARFTRVKDDTNRLYFIRPIIVMSCCRRFLIFMN